MATKKPNHAVKVAVPTDLELIDLRIDGGYVVAKHAGRVEVFEIVWERRHGDNHQRLTLRRCESVPRQFEREVFGDAGRSQA